MMMHIVLVTLLLVLVTVLLLSQAAGLAGFILGICNYSQTKRAHQLAIQAHQLAIQPHQLAINVPKLEAQREYREQLRKEVLFPVRSQCEEAVRALELGEKLPDHELDVFDYSLSQLEQLTPVLQFPRNIDMRMLTSRIQKVKFDWQLQIYESKPDIPGQPLSDAERRRYSAASQELRGSLDEALSQIKYCMKVTIDEDDKSLPARRRV